MKEKIDKALTRVQSDTRKANSKNTSTGGEPTHESLGKPDCPICGGVGFLRLDVPPGHEKFGRLEPCECRMVEVAQNARQRLYELSNLDRLSHLTFENFSPTGSPKAEFITPQEVSSLQEALQAV